MKPLRLAAIIWLTGWLAGTAWAEKKLNVLFITIDDLRPELGCYGVKEIRSPNIDRLAAKGVRFNRAYSQYPVCNPSRASFLTGRRPDELGILSNTVALREKWPDIVTLPQHFRNQGYFTAGLGKLFHMGINEQGQAEHFVDPASWEYFFNVLGPATKTGRQGEGRAMGGGRIEWCKWLAAEGDDEDQGDGLIAAEAVRMLEEHRNGPFFIGVGFHKPHDPFFAPKKYFELYPKDQIRLPVEPPDRSPRVELSIPGDSWNFADFTDEDRREFKRAYYACISFSDAQVGKVLDAMDRLKLWDDTIVLLLGDHGYHLGEHSWWNKVTVFEWGARAPLMMWVPGADGMGRDTDAITEFVDLFPTLIDYCGFKAPHALSGQSLRAVLNDPAQPGKPAAYTEVSRGSKGLGRSVRTNRWRYTEWGTDGKHGVELYDHARDAPEYYNLADSPEQKSVRRQMKKLLDEGFPE